MCRPLRDSGELLPQHGQHLAADEVDDLVDLGLGDAAVVEAEQHPAQGPEVGREPQHLLDDLGRAADGEAGLRDFLLERAARSRGWDAR